MAEVWRYESGGWEWADFYVYPHPREAGKFAVDIQSGCSCSSYEPPESLDLESEEPLDKAGVIAQWSRFTAPDEHNYVSAQEKAHGLEQLHQLL